MPLQSVGDLVMASLQFNFMDALTICVLWLVQKSGDAILSKLLDKLLSEKNLKRFATFLKTQILILYLDWVLLKTPLKFLPNQEDESEG